jgi:hypothetical protein
MEIVIKNDINVVFNFLEQPLNKMSSLQAYNACCQGKFYLRECRCVGVNFFFFLINDIGSVSSLEYGPTSLLYKKYDKEGGFYWRIDGLQEQPLEIFQISMFI